MTASDGRSGEGRGDLNQPPLSPSHGFGAALKVEDGKPRLPGNLHTNRRLSQWLAFHADGRVTITPGKVELGQGILTTLSQIAADELDVDFARITARPASTPDSPDEAVTSGSLSTQDSGSALRHACAAARMIFLGVVAQRIGVPLEAITHRGRPLPRPGRRDRQLLGAGRPGAAGVRGAAEASAKPPGARRIAGTSVAAHRPAGQGLRRRPLRARPAAAGDAACAGGAAAGARRDAGRDGARARCPAMRGWCATAASSPCWPRPNGMPRPPPPASPRRAAGSAADTLPEQAVLADWLREAADAGRAQRRAAARAMPAPPAARTLARSFHRPYLAHASIAPSCAVARWEGDAVEVCTHSQGPYNLRADLAKALRCAPETDRRAAPRGRRLLRP